MRKEIVLGLCLLGLILRPIHPHAEEAIVEPAVPAIEVGTPAEAVKDEPAPPDSATPPANELPPVETQTQSPREERMTEGFSKDSPETVKDEPAAAETVNEQPTLTTDPAIPPTDATPLAETQNQGLPQERMTETPLPEPQNQAPPQEKMSEEFSKELAAADAAAKDEERAGQRLGWVFGLRTGMAIPTQKVIRDFGDSTSVGPLVNVEGLYAVREWLRAGLMVEWHRHTIKMWGPDFGTLNTVSVLPTVEFRPTRDFLEDRGMTAVVPYASLGLGVNVNSLHKGDGLPSTATVSFNNTLAFRAAGGIDVPIVPGVALNAEVAYNLNSGDYQLSTLPATTGFNASTVNVLFGVRAEF